MSRSRASGESEKVGGDEPVNWPRAVAAALLLASLAGCSTASGGGRAPSTRATAATTTTLPTPIVVGGTQASGAMSFLGAVMRVTVEPVPAGRTVPATPEPSSEPGGGTPGDAVTVAFRQFGSGPDLVLVMGQSGSMTWWQPDFLQALAQHFRVTIFDLPDVGYSGPDAGAAPSVARYADVTAGLVDALGLHHPVLLGWGMGGELVLDVLVRHAGLAAAAVLADTSAGGSGAIGTAPAVARELAAPASTTSALATLLFPSDAAAARSSWVLGTLATAPDDVVPEALSAEAAAQAGWWKAGVTPLQLNHLAARVMVIWGTDDPVFSPDDGSALAASLRHDTVLTLPGDGYAALFESEATVVPAITAFAQAT
jgi:pimeloyl-ACP methyl ester carboxylesterase